MAALAFTFYNNNINFCLTYTYTLTSETASREKKGQ